MRSPTLIRRRAMPQDPPASLGRRRLAVAGWAGGALVLFAFLYRISLDWPFSSDWANISLQSWDMLHGQLLLHGWILSDAAFYTFEVPLGAIAEAVLGLSGVTAHVIPALTYLIVVVLAVALAVSDSRGAARAVRAGVVVAVMVAVPSQSGVFDLLQQADHTGTSAFLLGSFLLIDRFPGRRFTAPLLCVILCAGQVGDATVRYTAVPAIIVVCAYRVLAARRLRTPDTAIAIAAALSYPLATLVREAMRRLGGYVMLPPRNHLSPPHEWPGHLWIALNNTRHLFGAYSDGYALLGGVGIALGVICLIAAAFGFSRVIWSWRTASRAEQLLCAVIVATVVVYVLSTIPNLGNRRDIVAVLPCGAVLAARACVPGRIVAGRRAALAVAAAAVATLLPLTAAAARPVAPAEGATLATWLEAHHLTYGIAAYWDASDVTYDSGNRVQVRAVISNGTRFSPYYWETKASWYSAAQHDATFAIADIPPNVDVRSTVADFEHYFGQPAETYRVGAQVVLVYRKNLLKQVEVASLPRS
jgi:hypothetical protein